MAAQWVSNRDLEAWESSGEELEDAELMAEDEENDSDDKDETTGKESFIFMKA